MISTCKENIVEIVYMFWTEHVTFKERRRSEKGKEEEERKRKGKGERLARFNFFFFLSFFSFNWLITKLSAP